VTTTWPFRGIRADRPYPPTGLTTDRWKTEVAGEWVPLHQLWLTQEQVDIRALLGHTDRISDSYPHVVAHDDALYLEDGHHRVLRAWLHDDATRLLMRVYRSQP
jgi:hypothetical protein